MPGPSATNTFVPSVEASGNLWTGYSRNTAEFAINSYTQIIRSTKPEGLYNQWASRQAARVTTEGFEWADGAAAPIGNTNKEDWALQAYITKRYAIPFSIGQKAVNYADWPVLVAYSEMTAQQAMTLRSLLATACFYAVDWNGIGHLYNITGASGPGTNQPNANASWDTGTVDTPVIKQALGKFARKINVDTLGKIGKKNLRFVVNPNTAANMANTKEIHGYIKQSEYAQAEVRGDDPNNNGEWGLPSKLYGYEVVVDDAVVNPNPKGSDNPQYVVQDNTLQVMSRVGDLEGVNGGPNYSTIVGFFLEEMTVESKVDTDNRMTLGRVVEDYVYVCPSPLSGALATNLFASFSS